MSVRITSGDISLAASKASLRSTMRLVSFSVEKYRSITEAKRIDISESTVLLGPNNEGKSNLVRGLVLGMQTITRGHMLLPSGRMLLTPLNRLRSGYVWKRDFPIQLRDTEPNGETVFALDFDLEDAEIKELHDRTSWNQGKRLQVEARLGPSAAQVLVPSPNKGKKASTYHTQEIATFVREKVAVEYIPAIRTAESAERVVQSMLDRELSSLESNSEYIAALNTISELQKPLLKNLSQSVKLTMAEFLPAIQDVEFRVEEEQRSRAVRGAASVIVHDGSPTELKYKGDGVQSLAALALMRHASEKAAGGRTFVLVIEEPESHLHPEAMHSLRSVLNELRSKHQLILTTHSPLFIDRDRVRSNIIVENKIAKVATDLAEIRKTLGVRASDNLLLAEIVLLVEGDEDKIALEAIFRHLSPKTAESLNSHKLAIETLNGGGNLAYKAGMLRDTLLCRCYAFLDWDSAGRAAADKAIAQGVLSIGDITYAKTLDLKGESETEDLYDPKLYHQFLLDNYGVDVSPTSRTNRSKKKWSDRMKVLFGSAGKPWDDTTKLLVKGALARIAAEHPQKALHAHRNGPINSLITLIEKHCD